MKGESTNNMDDLFDIPTGMQDEVSDAARILRTFVSKVSAETGPEAAEIFSQPEMPQPAPVVALEEQASASFDSLQTGRSILPDRPASAGLGTNVLSGDDLILEDIGGDLPLLTPMDDTTPLSESDLYSQSSTQSAAALEPELLPLPEPEPEPVPAPPTSTRRSTRSRTFTFEAPVLVEDELEPEPLPEPEPIVEPEPVELQPVARKTPPPPPMAPIKEKKSPPPPPTQAHISEPPPSPIAPATSAPRDDFSIEDWYSSSHQPAVGHEEDVLQDFYKEQEAAKQQFVKTLTIVLPAMILFAVLVFVGIDFMTTKKNKGKNKINSGKVVKRKTPAKRKVVKRTPPKTDPRKVVATTGPKADGKVVADAGAPKKVDDRNAAPTKRDDAAIAAKKKADAAALAKKAAAAKAASDAAAKKKKAADAAAARKKATAAAKRKAAAKKAAARKAAARRAAARRAAARRAAARRAAAKKRAAQRAAKRRAAAKKRKKSTRVSAASKAASTRLYKQGLKLFFAGKVVPAQGYLVRSIRANPKNANAYRVLGLIYFRLGKKKLAKRAFKKFLRLQPTGPLATQIRTLVKNL